MTDPKDFPPIVIKGGVAYRLYEPPALGRGRYECKVGSTIVLDIHQAYERRIGS